MKANSVSLLSELRSTATVGVREATVLESSRGDLATGPLRPNMKVPGITMTSTFKSITGLPPNGGEWRG